jgi:hypothetical protein
MPVLAVGCEIDGIARALQRRAELAPKIWFVFDDQNAHCCFLDLFIFAPSTRVAAIGCLSGTKVEGDGGLSIAARACSSSIPGCFAEKRQFISVVQ